DSSRMTPLHYAAERLNFEHISILLAKGADVNAKTKVGKESALYYHLECTNDVETITLLLDSGADPNQVGDGGTSPLHLAAEYATPVLCKDLLDYGANIESLDKEAGSPVDRAVIGNSAENVQFFCDQGVILNRVDKDGGTVIDMVAGFGGVEIMQTLEKPESTA
ncbi:ankyrin, partial [Zopfia rhizophila CBS 207.26]